MSSESPIPIIDLFAGPGGLGEGFSSVRDDRGRPVFRIALSIETDEFAHETLLLRSFYRQFEPGSVPEAYYQYLRGDTGTCPATFEWLLDQFPSQGQAAKLEAWNATLGETASGTVSKRINAALGKAKDDLWVLIGGPPCQAYSLVGRARSLAEHGDAFYDDPKHTLYEEYLRIIKSHRPGAFVMENVKGLLSSTIRGDPVFERILADLRKPAPGLRYRLYSLVEPEPAEKGGENSSVVTEPAPEHFVVAAERHGIPQSRHRVIILGVQEPLTIEKTFAHFMLKSVKVPMPADAVLDGLPRLRSALSKQKDSREAWRRTIAAIQHRPWVQALKSNGHRAVADRITAVADEVRLPHKDLGDRWIECDATPSARPGWFCDPRVKGTCNHESRGHKKADLWRYMFAACYATTMKKSPTLVDFPEALRPAHENVSEAIRYGLFNDRFRVQLRHEPASTVTAHIAKDGHYFIHYDATQCRSLTVREAARLQTFPDNYFFEGPRTQQYRQVGNAVPPLLARQVGQVLARMLGLLSRKK